MDASTLPPTVGEVYTLWRVSEDGGEEHVSEHPDFADGWSAGQRAVHADSVNAYALYAGRSRVARFCYHRLKARSPQRALEDVAILGAMS